MSEEIVWGVGMNDAEFNRGIKRMLKEIDSLKQKVKELSAESGKASQQQKQDSEVNIAALGKMAATWLSVQSAMRLVVAEYENLKEAQKDAADETVATADAQIGFLRNLGNVSREERMKVIADMKAIANEVGQPVKNLYLAGQSSISAKGILTQQQMLESLKLAFKVAPESVDEAKSIAGALGDVASLTGHGDPERNMAFLLEANQQARAETLTQIAKGMLGRAISIKGYGGSGEEALAMATTLSNVMKDPEGQVSSTAALRLTSQMNEFGSGKNKQRVPGATPVEQLRYLQDNPEYRKRFFAQASFEGGIGLMPSQALATKGSEAAMLFEQNLAAMRKAGSPEAGALAKGFIGDIQAVPEQQLATQQRNFASTASALQLENFLGAQTSVNREGLDKILKASNASGLSRFGAARFFDLFTAAGNDPNQVAAGLLQERADTLRGVTPQERQGAVAANPQDEAIARKLDAMIAELQKLNKANAKPQKKNVDRNTE